MIIDFLNHMSFLERERDLDQIKISNELKSKGVAEVIIFEVLDNEGGWDEAANKAFSKRFRGPIN